MGIVLVMAMSVYGQSASTDNIAGSSIVLNNLSRSDVQKIMQGTVFDVFDRDLRVEYNTDLRRHTFLATDSGKEYQARLENLRDRLRTQGIRTIQYPSSSSTSSGDRNALCSISNYNVGRGGFTITLNEITHSRSINGFNIPGLQFAPDRHGDYRPQIFIPVSLNSAAAIEGNMSVIVQLQLALDTFAIQKIRLINERTNEVYAEVDY